MTRLALPILNAAIAAYKRYLKASDPYRGMIAEARAIRRQTKLDKRSEGDRVTKDLAR